MFNVSCRHNYRHIADTEKPGVGRQSHTAFDRLPIGILGAIIQLHAQLSYIT